MIIHCTIHINTAATAPIRKCCLPRRYKYNGAKLESEISAVLWFNSYSTTPPEPPKVTKVPVPAEKYIIYAGEDDLSLRAEPSVSGYLWKRMLLGTELICLEPKAQAKAKIGVQGQWIQVQDPKGDQGYVAAWYVSEQKGKPASSSTTITVSTSTTGCGTCSCSARSHFIPPKNYPSAPSLLFRLRP